MGESALLSGRQVSQGPWDLSVKARHVLWPVYAHPSLRDFIQMTSLSSGFVWILY